MRCPSRDWIEQAVRKIESERARSAETHLLRVDLAGQAGQALYLKDETTHVTGSLKHRLAGALFLQALCGGRISLATTIVDASSGSTAVSEAYFARLLGLRFIAVMPRSTSVEKQAQIASQGGEIHLVEDADDACDAARRLAEAIGGLFLDQFTNAERAVDWRRDNIAQAIFAQMAEEEHGVPTWIICGAGTGGTSATIGRYIRYHGLATSLCLADPEPSVYHRHLADRRVRSLDNQRSLIEGVGRPRVEPSFLPDVIDRVIAVPDAASIAAARVLSRHIGRPCGGSTGTNLWAAMQILTEMRADVQRGSVVTILCDSGTRYASTYFNDSWLAARGLRIDALEAQVERFLTTGSVAPSRSDIRSGRMAAEARAVAAD